MSDYDYGPLQTWEIIWRTGHVERIQGHQVLMESNGFMERPNPRLMIHGMFDRHWRLMLVVPEEDVSSIRLVTSDEEVPR